MNDLLARHGVVIDKTVRPAPETIFLSGMLRHDNPGMNADAIEAAAKAGVYEFEATYAR